LTKKIDEWCVKHGLPEGEAYQLYLRHGTALRGLLAEGHMEHCEDAIDKYLQDVHDLPIHTLLSRDEELRNMIESMDPSIPKYVFTASVSDHADRCLKALGIRDLFADIIIDVKACGLVTKHSKEAFQAAMKIANVDDPESCVFLDDSIKNIQAARDVGWRSILVGRVGRDCGTPISSDDAEHEIDRIHELPTIFPELFGLEV
jgi:putative hydrolase of the HAD superfamily/pyrimidine and pyridine-specific 5'-nucleotidase